MSLTVITDRKTYEAATDMIAQFGASARIEAATRADHSRNLGNQIRFCHWRRIERLIMALSSERSIGTVH
jgi:hypothetical protein